MSLSADEVKKIAYLARVGIDEDHIEEYAVDLSNMLGLMTQMGEANTDSIEPMAHPMNQVQRLREDKVNEVDQREYFQKNAPQTEAGLYLVPKVLD